MAITLQLARMDLKHYEWCKENENALSELISFESCPDSDYLDLDWVAGGINTYFEATNQLPEAKLALYLSINGTRLVNPNCRNEVNGYLVYSDIACLELDEVRIVVEGFKSIDWVALCAWLPQDADEANKVLGTELTMHPNQYYVEALKHLKNFYDEALERSLCVIMWWD